MTKADIESDTPAVGEDLKEYAQRIINLEKQKTGIADDIKDLFTEIKSKGYDTVILKKVIKDLSVPKSEIEQERDIYDIIAGVIREDF